jgi:hypothetical protein
MAVRKCVIPYISEARKTKMQKSNFPKGGGKKKNDRRTCDGRWYVCGWCSTVLSGQSGGMRAAGRMWVWSVLAK